MISIVPESVPLVITIQQVYLFGFFVGAVWITLAIYIQLVARIPPTKHIWAFYGVGMATTLLSSRVWIPSDQFILWSRVVSFAILLISAVVFFRYVSEMESIPPPRSVMVAIWKKVVRY